MTTTELEAPPYVVTDDDEHSEPPTRPVPATSSEPDGGRPDAAQAPWTWRRIVRIGAGLLLAFLLGFALFIPTVSGLTQQRTQTLLEQRLRSDLRNGLAPVNGPIADGTPLALLEIPSIGVRQVVVVGTRPVELAKGPGYLAGSALPGQPGVTAILGRRLMAGAPFRDLERLVAGDRVSITTGQGTAQYDIVDVTERDGQDAAAFLGQGNMVLLVSAESSPMPTGRIVARASLVSQTFPQGAPTGEGAASVSELGLDGDAGAAAPLLGWLQLLALTSTGAVLVARRVGGRVAWVLSAPPVAALCVLVWEQMALLFPGLS